MEEPLLKSLERYDVLGRIAVGGMAEVFLAKAYGSHGFEKTLAIKRILPDLAGDPEFAARFIAEAKVVAKLSHANVVQVFDFGRIGQSLFITMEFVDGLDLAALLRRLKDKDRRVPLPAAFHIALEVIRALNFAHSHNVVHRDVSPSNILLSRTGEVKLADFGIAVAASPHQGRGIGPRKVMGKWRYMSPEQARGEALDTRSDLFSAGSVIFEVFTGEKLFPGEAAKDIIKNIESMPIPRMRELRSGVPSRLDDVLGLALARKPIDRPSRTALLLRALVELSYESSIIATALDLAEVLASVLPATRQPGRSAIDDEIRRQLAEQSTVRRTAVTDGQPPSTEAADIEPTATGLFRKLDRDGLSLLEQVGDPMNLLRSSTFDDSTTSRADPATNGVVSGGVADISQASATVDIGILTILDEEFRAVLGVFSDKAGIHKGSTSNREYTLRHADAGRDERYTIAVMRQIERGNGEAQDAARDLIDDLAPRLVLVVGIAAGLPSDDVMLGDVVLSMRIHDFTIEARRAGEPPAYATTGGPIDKALAAAIANLAGREDELGNWTADLPSQPQVDWTDDGQFYGPPEWQRELRTKLVHQHRSGAAPRAPIYMAGPIGSSDRLIKDPELLFPWIATARDLLAVEMESGGVFRAARARCPMLTIRGISDIVGLKRSDVWTRFACASAAAFTHAFLRTHPV